MNEWLIIFQLDSMGVRWCNVLYVNVDTDTDALEWAQKVEWKDGVTLSKIFVIATDAIAIEEPKLA